MENIAETYGSVPIYKEGGSFYILCRDMNGGEHKIYSASIPALKRKITQSIWHDSLKLNGEHVYVYF